MPSHYWGDSWELWNDLFKAGEWIAKFYERLTGEQIHWKQKYGTIRYEHDYLWINDSKDLKLFAQVIKRAVKKFPNLQGEIVDDLICLFTDRFDQGWIAGVLWASSGSEWKHMCKQNKSHFKGILTRENIIDKTKC